MRLQETVAPYRGVNEEGKLSGNTKINRKGSSRLTRAAGKKPTLKRGTNEETHLAEDENIFSKDTLT